jgi:heme-degrading monooxygenase HmoA
MSVVVILNFNCDVEKLETLFVTHEAEFEQIAAAAKGMGALQHRFVAGDGEALIIDEWESAEAFDKFFKSQPKIPELMAEADVIGPPEVNFYRLIDDPGQF